jgi:pilus assembly protein CpaF
MSLRDRLQKSGGSSPPPPPSAPAQAGGGNAGPSQQAAPPPAPVKSEAKSQYLQDFKTKIHALLVDNLEASAFSDTSSRDEVSSAAHQFLEQYLVKENIPMSRQDRETIVQDLVEEILGLGPLEVLLKDSTVSDILINGPYSVYVERFGKLQKSQVVFKDQAHLMHIIERIVSAVGRRVDEKTPMVDARLKDGSRFNAIIPPLALDGASVSIRKFRQDAGTLEKLLGWGSLTPAMAEALRAAVQCRLNIIISGGTGSGKTTLLNSLSAVIPEDERIVTIEDSAELQLQQDHVVRLETRPPNVEGEGAVHARHLVINALRMRPDRIVIGECRGGETLDMLQAMNTGHDGSLTTLHANTPRDAIARIETMCLMNEHPLPEKAIKQQVASAVHIIVQASRLQDGSRKVTSITEVVGMEGQTITMQEIFKFEQSGVDANGKVIGRHVATGVRPKFAVLCESMGIFLPNDIFQKEEAPSASGGEQGVTSSPPPAAAPPPQAAESRPAESGSLRDALMRRNTGSPS